MQVCVHFHPSSDPTPHACMHHLPHTIIHHCNIYARSLIDAFHVCMHVHIVSVPLHSSCHQFSAEVEPCMFINACAFLREMCQSFCVLHHTHPYMQATVCFSPCKCAYIFSCICACVCFCLCLCMCVYVYVFVCVFVCVTVCVCVVVSGNGCMPMPSGRVYRSHHSCKCVFLFSV